MNREQHIREAERLLKGGHAGESVAEAANRIAEAHVHALLALAAEPAPAEPPGDPSRRTRAVREDPAKLSGGEDRQHAGAAGSPV